MLNIKEIEQSFIDKLKEVLLNKEFDISESFPIEIPKFIGDVFISNLLEKFNDVVDFDIKPIIQNNMLLVKIETRKGTTLVDVIAPIKILDKKLIINDIFVSIKNI